MVSFHARIWSSFLFRVECPNDPDAFLPIPPIRVCAKFRADTLPALFR